MGHSYFLGEKRVCKKRNYHILQAKYIFFIRKHHIFLKENSHFLDFRKDNSQFGKKIHIF